VIALLIIAALAFDVGMMLVERRDEQNAADAAALAGARYVLTSVTDAEAAARQISQVNGFDDADPNQVVNIYIPPLHGKYTGFAGFIEVQIQSTRPSIFGGIVGRATWPVGVFAVATNKQDLNFPFSMMALNPTACASIKVSGGGVVQAFANIQSNSNGAGCAPADPVGFSRSGGSTINVIADDATCRSVGLIVDQGSGSMTCTKAQNSFALPDPLRNLPAPPKPVLAPAMHYVGAEPPPAQPPKNCPGRPSPDAPNELSPNMCSLGSPSGTYKNLEWILYPGLYPGGLEVSAGTTAYLMPGIYWIGGGGLSVKGGGSILTVANAAGATPDVTAATWGGGVLIYNSKLPTAPGGVGGPINLDGSGATMKLKALDVPLGLTPPDPNEIYNHMVIFQDRTVTSPVTLNGSASSTQVEGIIYVPAGQIKLNGNGGTLIVDQIIADTFDIQGNGGTIKVLHGTGVDAVIVAAGLVE
jgi:hypothetical protein